MLKTCIQTLFILLIFSACSQTRHIVTPNYGAVYFQPQDTLLTTWFAHYDATFAEKATRKMRGIFNNCSTVTALPPEQSVNFLYKSFVQVSMDMELSEKNLADIHHYSNAKYLLTGRFVSQVYGDLLYSKGTEHAPLPDDSGGWSRLEFVLYDLERRKEVFRIETETESGQFDIDQEDGDVIRIHSLEGTSHVALRKSVKKLRKLCNC